MYREMIAAARYAMNSGLTRIVQNLQTRHRSRHPRRGTPQRGRITEASAGPDGFVTPEALPSAASLPKRIAELLPQDAEDLTILDMRPGPWTFQDCVYPTDTVRVVAFDPLAGKSDLPPSEDGSAPAVTVPRLPGEERLRQFTSNTFDLVFARDWVDRSRNAEQAILEMMRIVKPGCYVLLEHHPSRAEGANGAAHPPWDFSTNEARDFVIRSRVDEINLTQRHRSLCSIDCTTINDGEWWLITRIRKHPLSS